MTHQEAMEYLLAIPMFQQVGGKAMNPGTEKIEALCEAAGNPQKQLRTIHIAGTNGKGSTAHLIASILMATGYNTGLFTSPHLHDFRERIRINGALIEPEEVTRFIERMQKDIEQIRPSFFEIVTVMAFDCFARRGTDIAVIETGMGGRLDATNIISPLISVITNIDYDHTEWLGDTLQKIAGEKAGIIKPQTPVIIGETRPETAAVFIQKAHEGQAPITFADKRFACINAIKHEEYQTFELQSLTDGYLFHLNCDLLGDYQKKNILTVLTAAEVLNSVGVSLSRQAVEQGAERCARSTGLQGRWQVLNRAPYMVCDTGHNANGLQQTMRQINTCRFRKLYMIIGFVRDKELGRIFPLLPKEATYFFTRPSCPRGLEEQELKRKAEDSGLSGTAVAEVNEAIEKAVTMAGPEDMIYIGGSTYLVADIDMGKWGKGNISEKTSL